MAVDKKLQSKPVKPSAAADNAAALAKSVIAAKPVKPAVPIKTMASPLAAPAVAQPPVSAPLPTPVVAEPAAPVPAAPPVAAEPIPPIEPAPVAPAAPSVVISGPVSNQASPPAVSIPETLQSKEIEMTEAYTTATDALKNGAEQIKSTMAGHTENAMAQGKATFEQVASKSREAIEHGMKSVDEMAGMARGNVEAMLASSRAAAQGIEAIAREVSDFARKSFEETTAAARAMTTVKSPNELMQLQNDFAKTQFDAAVAEMSKLSETMVKLMGEVFEPMQARATVATDSMKSMVGKIGL